MTNNALRNPFPSPDTVVVTDAGLETWLLFDRGVDLPAFAAYPLAGTADGRALLTEYYQRFLAIASGVGAAVVLEAPTWRANPDWAATLGHDRDELARLIAASVSVVDDLRSQWHGEQPFIVGGAVGPRGDGYRIDDAMSAREAAAYHAFQLDRLAATPVDVATAMTICYVDEAVGIALAARDAGLPIVLSFTVETDGRLPSGATLADAIGATDDATGGYPLHYMVNCAHPTHLDRVLADGPLLDRLRGLRANASAKSHAELDEAAELDRGDPDDLAARYADLGRRLPALHVIGGCCGTDDRHVEAIAHAFRASQVEASRNGRRGSGLAGPD
jgi:homocysteine S-methyltransferase